MPLPAPESSAAFGPFRLFPAQRVLLAGEQPVRLGSRAFDILAMLVDRAGATVTKRELIARVWPDTIVEEANLRVHVAALRKVLGTNQRYIGNVTGQGYAFVAPVRWEQAGTPAAPHGQSHGTVTHALAHAVAARLAAHALVTLTGTGGVGKSHAAHAAAALLAARYTVHVADLAAAPDPASALAAALGLPPGTDPVPALRAGTGSVPGRPHLVLLDNCDRCTGAAAALAERLLRDLPGTCVLATSRIALRAAGEQVHRIEPLACPPAGAATARDVLAAPAAALFVARAVAVLGSFTLTDADAPAVAELCRRLDGLPLALELAAARLDLFPPHQLLERLDERLPLLKGGRRTAPPRQQSLLASLAWSWDTLAPAEQAVLSRLALLSGPFTLARAEHTAAGGAIAPGDVAMALAALEAHALVVRQTRAGDGPTWRLYENVRIHALAQLPAADGARVCLDGPDAGRTAFARAFALAEQQHDTERLADAFSGLALEDVLAGEYGAALALAGRFRHAVQATGAHAALLVHDRVAALALHLSGDQHEAAALARAVLNQTAPAVCTRRRMASQTDENVAAGVVLARGRWLLGDPGDALRMARNGVLRARAVGADTSRCYALAFALFPVAWWCGDRAVALEALAELEDAARALPNWRGLAYQYRTGVVDGGPVAADAALAAGPHRETLATLDPRYLDDALLLRAEQGGARWCAAELRRLHGERLLNTGDVAVQAEAERLFRAALLLARQQGVPGWELRAAMSLARLWHRRGATGGAHALLAAALHRFPHEPPHPVPHDARTADLALAAKLLAQWRRMPERETAGSALACALPA